MLSIILFRNAVYIDQGSQGPYKLQVLTTYINTYKLNLPSKAVQLYKSLYLHHGPYKSS